MKTLCVLPVSLVVSVALLAVLNIRKKELVMDGKQSRFNDIKLRVTYDVLKEYENENKELQGLLERTLQLEKSTQEELKSIKTTANQAKSDVETCQGNMKSQNNERSTAETELKKVQDELHKGEIVWTAELDSLKKQLEARSAVCDFVKSGSPITSKLCGINPEAPEEEEAKPEAPKQEEVKPEAPKQEEAKPEAPKQEEAKPEAPKQEEAKPEAPKQEEAKPEAPKQEEAKPEAPKQ